MWHWACNGVSRTTHYVVLGIATNIPNNNVLKHWHKKIPGIMWSDPSSPKFSVTSLDSASASSSDPSIIISLNVNSVASSDTASTFSSASTLAFSFPSRASKWASKTQHEIKKKKSDDKEFQVFPWIPYQMNISLRYQQEKSTTSYKQNRVEM